MKGKIEPVGEIIWHKGYPQRGSTAWGSFRSPSDPALADQHEYILVLRKYGQRHRPDAVVKIASHHFNRWRNSIWKISPERAKKIGHPAPFPVEIPRRLITLYSFENEVVLDPFMGSGTTAVAAKQLGRRFIGFDEDPRSIQTAQKRLAQ